VSKQSLPVLTLVMALLAPSLASAEQPIEAVMAAFEIDMGLVITSSIDTQGSSATMYDVRSSLGVISPYNAPTFGVLSTGNVNNIEQLEDYDYPGSGADTSAGDRAAFSFDIEVPQYANSFSFNFYFLSREYPEWVGSDYNDTFEVHLDSNAYQGQIVFDAFGNPVTVNNALFSVVNPASLAGTGFDNDGGTGWVTTIAPCEGGETMHMEFEIYDVADGVWDSAVLLDNFQFSENEPPEDGPWTGDDTPDVPIEVAFLSPKEGDIEGGYEVNVHGSGFDQDTIIQVDGVTLTEGNDVHVGTGGETLIIEVWPTSAAEGPVDIVIRKGLEEVTLANAFTYWDESGGSVPPRVTAVMPSEAHPDGGTALTVRGVGIDSGATVVFRSYDEDGAATDTDGADVEVHDLEGGGQEIYVTTPAHDEGWADLVVINSTGLEADPPYPFLFDDGATTPAGEGTVPGRNNCTADVAGVADVSGLLALLALFGVFGLVRGREGR
jgi:hypothetical protein